PGVGVTISVNARLGQLRIDGAPAQVTAWRSVIEALDSPPTIDNKVTKIVSTKSASHDRVRKALEVLRTDGATRPQENATLISTLFQPRITATADAQPPAGTA